MLNPDVIKAFIVTAELTGTTLTKESAEVAVEHLSQYPTEVVLRALHRCRIELRGPLTLGAVMDRLDDGHPGPESAWALVAKLDEGASVVWTDEICQAFAGVRGLLEDRVQARMAFLEVYRAKLAEARSVGRAPHWWASLGWDPSGRQAALSEAVELRRLTVQQAMAMLPAPLYPQAWHPERALPVPEMTPEDRDQRLAEIAELTKQLSQRRAVWRNDPSWRGPTLEADETYFETLKRGIESAEITRQQGQEGAESRD